MSKINWFVWLFFGKNGVDRSGYIDDSLLTVELPA